MPPAPKYRDHKTIAYVPATKTDCCTGDADPTLTAQTQRIAMGMLSDLLHAKKTKTPTQAHIWADDMIWYGPSGIGTFYGLDGFDMYRRAFLIAFQIATMGLHTHKLTKTTSPVLLGGNMWWLPIWGLVGWG